MNPAAGPAADDERQVPVMVAPDRRRAARGPARGAASPWPALPPLLLAAGLVWGGVQLLDGGAASARAPFAPLFAQLERLSALPDLASLALENVTLSAAGPRLVLRGRVVNRAAKPQAAPGLALELLDGGGDTLVNFTVAPGDYLGEAGVLPAGASRDFHWETDDPDAAAVRYALRWQGT